MRHRELESRLEDRPWKFVHWAASGDLTQALYNIVPLDAGYTIYCPSDREGFFRLYTSLSEPASFDTEDEVCGYIWQRAQEAERPAPRVPARTPEQIADRKRRMNENRVAHGLEPLP
jgi:hypothetical protein